MPGKTHAALIVLNFFFYVLNRIKINCNFDNFVNFDSPNIQYWRKILCHTLENNATKQKN